MTTTEKLINKLANDPVNDELVCSAINRLEELDSELTLYKNALWKACGDDEEVVNATLESQRQ